MGQIGLRQKRLGWEGLGQKKNIFSWDGMGLGHKFKKMWDGMGRVPSHLHPCFYVLKIVKHKKYILGQNWGKTPRGWLSRSAMKKAPCLGASIVHDILNES